MIKATVVGNCGRQPELSDTKAGKPMCRFSVASNMKNAKTGETKTSWVNVICFDEMADVVAAKVKSGDRLIVSGRLEFDEYEDRNGVKKDITHLHCGGCGSKFTVRTKGAKSG